MPSKESFYALCLSLDRKECMQVLLHMETSTATSIIKQTRTAKQRQDCDNALLRSIARLFSQREDSIFLQSLIIKETIYHALCGTYGNALLDTLTKVRELDSIKANMYIKEHFARNFTVKDLAKRSAMSVSAFHKQFKNTIGMSVIQCQKALRLSEARRLLVWEDYNATQAAFEVGYESLSQFIREYKRAFIVSPKEDRQALLAQISRI